MDDRKTQASAASVDSVLDAAGPDRARDARAAAELMSQVTGAEPVVWGTSIVGFGIQPYTTADGRQREWFAVGVAPRKASLTLYGLTYSGSNDDLLARLGPHTTGKGCLYVKRLADLDQSVLTELVARSWAANTAAPQ